MCLDYSSARRRPHDQPVRGATGLSSCGLALLCEHISNSDRIFLRPEACIATQTDSIDVTEQTPDLCKQASALTVAAGTSLSHFLTVEATHPW